MQLKFFSKKIKILKNYFYWKKIIQNQKVPKHIFSWSENFLNKVSKKIFFRKKYTEKNSFRKNISKLIFFTNSILRKNFTKIFLKNWKKKILEIFISIFKKLRKKNRSKKKSVKCWLIHRFRNGKLSVKMLVKLG